VSSVRRERVLKSDDDVPPEDLYEAIGILVDVMDKWGMRHGRFL